MRRVQATATLVPDAGASAFSEEYFRSAHHLRAEQVTHTLRIQDDTGGMLRVPLIVRPIEGTPYRDAISPYGFPGGEVDGLCEVLKHSVDWRAPELVSIFVRDRVEGPRCFADATARNEVFVVDPRRPLSVRETHRRHMRRNARQGFVSTVGASRDSSREEREGFQAVYRQTMIRDGASPRYFFSDAYFEELFASAGTWLATTRAPDGQVGSATVKVRPDGRGPNKRGGAAGAHRAPSPAKNVFETMIELCKRLELPLHLGGGLQPGDGLEDFKRGFANASTRLHTHEVICEPGVYARLSEGCPDRDFFPAYRGPRG